MKTIDHGLHFLSSSLKPYAFQPFQLRAWLNKRKHAFLLSRTETFFLRRKNVQINFHLEKSSSKSCLLCVRCTAVYGTFYKHVLRYTNVTGVLVVHKRVPRVVGAGGPGIEIAGHKAKRSSCDAARRINATQEGHTISEAIKISKVLRSRLQDGSRRGCGSVVAVIGVPECSAVIARRAVLVGTWYLVYVYVAFRGYSGSACTRTRRRVPRSCSSRA